VPITKYNIEEFLPLTQTQLVLDVRSPGEYEHAHIPNAISLPLFTDEERKVIGTAYKQESRERAIKIGLECFGKNMLSMVERVEELLKEKKSSSREVGVHCWRGGMRSSAVAWLLDLYGFKVYLLAGGYKMYRRWVLQQFEQQYNLGIIGGYTGSNKTGIIHELQKTNEQVIDLEGLANHKGSAFGNLENAKQPSQEQFENLLATQLYHCSSQNGDKKIWLENESQRIGLLNIPQSFFKLFNAQSVYFIDVPFEERLKNLVQLYGNYSKESLINAIMRITKKLGGLEAKTAINFLLDDDIYSCFSLLLKYYDKLYLKTAEKRKQDEKQITYIRCPNTDAKTNLQKLLSHANGT